MKAHRLTNWILALSVLAALSGCAQAPAPAEDVSSSAPPAASADPSVQEPEALTPFTLAFYPDYSIHPALAGNRANLALAPLLYEGLFTVDDAFQAVPVLCQSYEVSEDGLTWTFQLRSNVTFSDGTLLTGQIAAQALTTALGEGSRYAGRISNLRSITGSEGQVVLSLTTPNGDLPALLDIPLALDSSDRPFGTGPYVLAEENGTLFLAARDDWWQNKPLSLREIYLCSIQQADDLIAAFDSGDITLLDVDLTGTNTLGYSGSYEVWDYNTTDLIYLGFNTVKGYCKDAQVRQALGRAIDRESITAIPYARHAVAAVLPVHPGSPLYDQDLAAQSDYAPETLVELLQSRSGPGQPLKLVVNSENNAKVSAAQYIAYQLQAAGLEVEVEKLSWDSYLAALTAGSFDLYVGEVMLTADFDLSALVSSSGALNYGGWTSEQTDQLLAAFRAASGAARGQAAQQLYAHLTQSSPIAPICFKHGSLLTQWGRLAGLQPRQSNIFYGLDSWQLDP